MSSGTTGASSTTGPVIHPYWCAMAESGCTGHHRSRVMSVPMDEHAGGEVQAHLWGGRGEPFVDLTFGIGTGRPPSAGCHSDCLAIAGRTQAPNTGARAGGGGPAPSAVRPVTPGATGAGPVASPAAGIAVAGKPTQPTTGNEGLLGDLDARCPLFVDDPHGHDLSLGQARILYQALGRLLELAQGHQSDPDEVGPLDSQG